MVFELLPLVFVSFNSATLAHRMVSASSVVSLSKFIFCPSRDEASLFASSFRNRPMLESIWSRAHPSPEWDPASSKSQFFHTNESTENHPTLSLRVRSIALIIGGDMVVFKANLQQIRLLNHKVHRWEILKPPLLLFVAHIQHGLCPASFSDFVFTVLLALDA